MLMEFPIIRLILASERWNGTEKAERHLELSTKYVASKMLISEDAVKSDHWDTMILIHDATCQLSATLEKLGMKREEWYDIDKVSEKFFNQFLLIANKEWERVCQKKTMKI